MRAKLTSSILLLSVCAFGFSQVRPPVEGWNFQTLLNGDWKTKPTEVNSGQWFRVEIRSQHSDTYVDSVDVYGVPTPRQTLIPNLEHECELVEISNPAFDEFMPFIISGQDGSAGELTHETMLKAKSVAPGITMVRVVRVRIKDTQSPYSTKHDSPIEISTYVAIKG